MTFRIDDLLVSVLPEGMADAQSTACGPNTQCTPCTKCTCRTAPPTPCDDPATNQCHICQTTCEDTSTCDDSIPNNQPQRKKSESWRAQQFELLSQELETALSR